MGTSGHRAISQQNGSGRDVPNRNICVCKATRTGGLNSIWFRFDEIGCILARFSFFGFALRDDRTRPREKVGWFVGGFSVEQCAFYLFAEFLS